MHQPPAGCAGYQRNQSSYPFSAPVAKIAAGHAFSYALDHGGRLSAWGLVSETPPTDHFGEVLDAPVGEQLLEVYGGYYHATAIKPNRHLIAWGKNTDGQAEPPTDVAVFELSSKYDHGVALVDCYPDFDGNQRLDFFDLLGFLDAVATADIAADCDNDSAVTAFDLLCFQEAFEVGCEWPEAD